jgi:hypothetical protein
MVRALVAFGASTMNDPAEHRRLVRDAIVAHIQQHPDASDTAEGISGWWLGPSGCGESLTVVEEALDELVRSGVMRRRQLPDGGVVYRASRGSER